MEGWGKIATSLTVMCHSNSWKALLTFGGGGRVFQSLTCIERGASSSCDQRRGKFRLPSSFVWTSLLTTFLASVH